MKAKNRLFIFSALFVILLLTIVVSASAADYKSDALPVVYIDTEDSAEVTSKDEYINSDIRIYDKAVTIYDGASQIKGHGNSTWKRFDKKPFKLKLDKKTDLFGMGKSKHWLLIANYIDDSLMRNALSVEIAKMFGAEYLDCTWVEVVFNGKHIGNYQLYEQAKLESTRIDIYNWENTPEDIAKAVKKKDGLSDDDQKAIEDKLSENMTWMSSGCFVYNNKKYTIRDYIDIPDDFTGGILYELDSGFDELSRFKTDRDAPINIKNPENLYTDELAMLKARNIVQTMEDSFYSADNTVMIDGEKVSYTDLCDADSLISFFLANEMLQSEAAIKSTYFYKDTDGKVVFGPVWDFDFSSNNVAPFGATNPETWSTFRGYWFNAVADDPYFAVKARELYLKNYNALSSLNKNGGLISQWQSYLKESALENDKIWPYSRGFASDTQVLKSWMTDRLEWITRQFADDNSAVTSLGGVTNENYTVTVEGSESYNEGCYLKENQLGENVKVTVNAPADCNTVNCYVNGKFIGETAVENGSGEYIIPVECLTEKTGSKNVIVIRNKDNLNEINFVTVTVLADDIKLSDVMIFDGEKTTVLNVVDGTNIYLGKSVQNCGETIISGWNDGFKTYAENSLYTVSGNVRITATLLKCRNSFVHNLQSFEYGYYCTVCDEVKTDVSNLISVAACTFEQSSRYSNAYTGTHLAPVITVSYNGNVLTEGVDYEIVYSNDINTGFATYTVTGIPSAGYRGTVSLSYGIVPASISKASVEKTTVLFDGTDKEPELNVSFNGIQLIKDKDYTVRFENNIQPGKATATLNGIGNFNGKKVFNFNIDYPIEAVGALTLKQQAYNQVSLSWSKVADCDSYIVYRKTADESGFTQYAKLFGKKKTTFIDTDVPVGKKVYYKVAAGKTVNDLYFKGSTSATKSITTSFDATKASVSSVTATSVKLTWTKVSGAKYYNVEQSTDGKKWTSVVTTDKTSCTVSKLKAGTKYQFRVTALDSTKKISGKVSAVLKTGTLTSAPAIKLTSTKKATATVTITKVTGATKYTIYKSTDNKKWTKVTDTTNLTYNITGLTAGKKIYVKVVAVNAYGKNSADSKLASVTVKK